MSKRTYNKTCEGCGEVFVATGSRQKVCDDCWGAEMGADRVEYLVEGAGLRRHAIIICSECGDEYAIRSAGKKRVGLCKPCSLKTPETRANMSAGQRGRKHPPEVRAKIGAASTGRTHSPETRAKMSAAATGRTHSPESRAKLSAAATGRTPSPETRAKMSAANTGRTHSPETRATMSAKMQGNTNCLGRTLSPETRAKMRATTLRNWQNPDYRAKILAAWRDPEVRKKMAWQGFGYIYLCAGQGMVKVGGSRNAETLHTRLADHSREKGWDTVLAIWELPAMMEGGLIEVECIIALTDRWECVTSARITDGNEAVYTNDWDAAVELVNGVIGDAGVMTDLRDPDVTWAVAA